MKKIILFLMVFTIGSMYSQNMENYIASEFKKDGEIMPFRILYPENFFEENEYPLILFLHGAGERGNNNKDQLIHSTKLLNREKLKDHPAIVLIPQCSKDDYWSNVEINYEKAEKFIFKPGEEPTNAMKMVMALMDSVIQQPFIDREKIYVGGLSMGGMGTFEILYRKPEMFAAAFPVCGGAHPATVKTYAEKVPLWIFHGSDDQVVLPEHSIKMAEAINEAGGNAKLTIYPNTGHNSWDPAFAEPNLLDWLFSKNRKPNQKLRTGNY